MGLGFFTSEEVMVDAATGKLLSDGTWEYKIPAATCIPRQFNATFIKARHAPHPLPACPCLDPPPCCWLQHTASAHIWSLQVKGPLARAIPNKAFSHPVSRDNNLPRCLLSSWPT